MAHQPPGEDDPEDATAGLTGSLPDAASFIRRHAGEFESDLTSEQRDLLGRVIARRIARGEKIELLARAVSHALPELGAERAQRLGRDETLRARAWEDLARLRAAGVAAVAISAARDACPACRAASGSPPRAEEGERSALPSIPIAGCTHPAGCRCRYVAASDAPPAASPADSEDASNISLLAEDGSEEQSTRPWYRPRPPRPHGPRWTEEERAAHARRAPRPPAPQPRHKHPPR